MALGELVVKMSADIANFVSAMDRAAHIANRQSAAISNALSAVQRQLGGLGAGLTIGGMVAFVKSGIDAADALNKLSQKVGVSVESLSALNYAARLADVSAEQLQGGLQKLAKGAADAQAGTGDAADAFKAMGISVTDTGGQLRGTEDLLLSVAQKFSGMEDSAGKTALAMKIFGKSGAELIPFLNQGRDGIEQLRTEAERLGIIISGPTAKAAENFNDQLTRLAAGGDKLKFSLAESVLPALNRVVDAMVKATEAGEGLMGKLRALGQLSPAGDLFKSEREIVQLTDELLSTEKEIANKRGKAGREELSALEAHMVRTEKRLREVQKLRGVLAGELDPFGDPAKPKAAEKAKDKAPIISDSSAAKRAAEQAAAAKLRLLDQLANAEVSAIKDSATRQEAILDAQHQAGLLSEMAYWTQKGEIQKAAQDAALNAMNAQIERQVALVLAQKNGTKEYFDALGDLEKSLEQRNKLEADGEQAVKMLGMSAERAAKSWNKEVEDLNIQLMELKGNSIGAAQARFNAQTSGLRERSVVNKRPDVTASIDEARNLNQLQLQFNESREQLAEINARLQIDEDRIRNSGLGELQVMGKTDAARQSAVERLKEVVSEMQRIAELAKNPALVLQADQAAAALENLGARANEVGETYGAMFKDNFANAFADFVSGSKSAKDAFKDFANNIVKELTRMQSQALATNIWNVINGKGEKGQAGGGAGGIVDKLMGLLKGGGTQVNAAGTNKESATKDETLAFWGPGSDLAKATEAQVLGAEEVTDSFAKIGAQSIESIAKSLLVETSMTTLSSTALSSAAESMAASLLVETSMTTLSAAALQAAAALKAISASEAVESDGGSGIGSMLKGLFGGGGGGGELASVGATQLLGGFASGTEYVPKTGPYMLHQGERVVQESENRGGGSVQVTLNVGSLDPSMAAGVIMKNEALILGLFRRAYNQRGVTTPIG